MKPITKTNNHLSTFGRMLHPDNYIKDPLYENIIIDMKHLLAASRSFRILGNLNEWFQGNFGNKKSAYNPQDYYSNNLGFGFRNYLIDIYGETSFPHQVGLPLIINLSTFLLSKSLRQKYEP